MLRTSFSNPSRAKHSWALGLVVASGCSRTALLAGVVDDMSAGVGGWTGDERVAGGRVGGVSSGGRSSSGGQAVGGGEQVATGGYAGEPLSSCSCAPREVCLESSAYCVCAAGTFGEDCLPCDPTTGEFEWPGGSGRCETDPCLRLDCQEPGECLEFNGKAACICDEGWSGPNCDRKYVPYRIPPFAEDVVFDSQGNGWFRTARGLLYWDFGSTPRETADDAFHLYDYEARGELAIDSLDRKWLVQGNGLFLVDHKATPLDPADDQSLFVSAQVGAFDGFVQVDVDAEGRPWAVAADRSGAFVLRNPLAVGNAEPEWLILFENEKILELAPEESGVWLVTAGGLFYVDGGSSLTDPADDVRVDFSDVAELAGETIRDIDIDSVGAKWFTTDRRIVVLHDVDGPLTRMGDVWSIWSPAENVKALGDGPLMALGPDDARWLMTPSDAVLRIEASLESAPQVTEYAPQQCTQFQQQQGEAAIDMELTPEGRLLLTGSGSAYILDFGGTPLEPADDVWTRLPRSPSGLALHPSRGYWAYEEGPMFLPSGCSRALYYLDLGNPRDHWDDRATSVAPPGLCPMLEGVDARGRLWVSTYEPSGEGALAALDPGLAPASVTVGDWAVYPDDSPPFELGSWLLGDSDSLWLGGTRFDPGASLADRSDDRFLALDSFTPKAVSVDGSGGKWFAYNDWRDEGVPALLRRLDDGGTPWDRDDDAWQDFQKGSEIPNRGFEFLDIDPLGRVWILGETNYSYGRDLISFDAAGTLSDPSDDVWTRYGKDDALPQPTNVFVIDESSNLWLGSLDGVGYLHVER